MVIRWNHLTALVVVTLAVSHCEQINASLIKGTASNIKFEDSCPCLPANICPHVFGTQPDDAKYLGDIKKCDNENEVRCCGASASFVVGTTAAPNAENITTSAPQYDILTRLKDDDVQDNEISGAESDKSAITDNDEILSVQETGNIANFRNKQRLNGETDDEAAESESVVETVKAESQKPIAPKSHRKPKTLDDDSVVMVYPNIMSGVPKTTPRNMPDSNEMTMFDQEVGMDLHLVFSETTIKPETTTTTTTTKPEPVVEVQTNPTSDSTTKQSRYQFAKRRRQFRPIQRITTESPTKPSTISPTKPSTISPTKPSTITPIESPTKSPIESPTESSVADMEFKPLTLRNPTITRQRKRLRNSTTKPATEESTNPTTKRPRTVSSTKPTKAPSTQEEEILMTSDDDKSQQSRFRLFNARHRLNYLRRNTTATSTESSIETTTHLTTQSKRINKKEPSTVNETPSRISIRRRPSKMNETLIRTMDTNHREMISKVRDALTAETAKSKATEIPRSFASVDMNDRVKKLETMLAEKMINAYTETIAKRRRNQPKRKEADIPPISNTDQPIATPTLNSTTPYRGTKKFMLNDLLDKTPVVTMSPIEFRRTMRVRTTTVKPLEQDNSVATTTRSRRRRPTAAAKIEDGLNEKEANNLGGNAPESIVERNHRRRVDIRRRFNVDPSSSSTPTLPLQTSNDGIPTRASDSTIQTTTPTISTSTPETTTLTQAIESTTELHEQLEREPDEESNDETIQSVDIEENDSTNAPPTENSGSLSDFKPSPLWSISSDDETDIIDREENHSYDMNMNERSIRKGRRQSRSAFEPPAYYLNGFTPVTSVIGPVHIIGPIPKSSKSGDDTKVRYSLPIDSKADFSKN